MKTLRTHPTTHAKTKVAALVAAALLAASSAGVAAAEEGEEWEGAEELECSGCGNGVGLRGQVLATSNPNKAIESVTMKGYLGHTRH